MFTDDPYLVDIKLDENSSNRSAEILNAYLKTMGYKLEFEKTRKKKVKPYTTSPFRRIPVNSRMTKPFVRMAPTQQLADFQKYMDWLFESEQKMKKRPFLYKPFKYEVRDEDK